MRIISVIGAGYGDEGKGLSVDALARKHLETGEVTVVRVNGGAQAGHTVQTEDGRRHVFHQFGAGSLAGARTHWSKDFVAGPMFWASEAKDLRALGARTDAVTADPNVLLTTPWDVLINQAAEEARGGKRHGSCGMGFGETIERSERNWGLRLSDIGRRDFSESLTALRMRWVPQRLEEHGVDPAPWANIALSDKLLADFLADCERMMSEIVLVPDHDLAYPVFGQILTEGAQGLGLDMDVGAFPHVTRSHTGLRNVMRFAKSVEASTIEAVYATRAYATRHGAGPFPGEADVTAWADVVDPTNAPNAWQGTLRTGFLDLDVMLNRMNADAQEADADRIHVTRKLNVTCLDQLRNEARLVISGDEVRTADPVRSIASALRATPIMASSAPHAGGVRHIEDRVLAPAL